MKKPAIKPALKPSNATNVQSVLQLEVGRSASKPAPTSTQKVDDLELSVKKITISSALSQTTPGGDDKLQNVHPAANIFRDHLLRSVVEENDKLREEILRLKPARDLLGRVEIVTKSGRVLASAWDALDFWRIAKSCTACVCGASSLSVLFGDFNSLPLAELFEAKITMADRDVAYFPEESLRVDYLEDKPINVEDYFLFPINGEDYYRVAFNLGRGQGFVGGLIRGASEDDIIHLRNTPEKDRQISAEQSHSFTFVPGDIQWFVGDVLLGIIRAFGPRPMYDGDEPLESEAGKPRYAFLSDGRIESIQLSSDDEALRSIVDSLDGDESQMAVLNENESLKNVRFRHEMAAQLLGAVEISHPQGKIKLSLRDGQLSTPRGSYWFVSVKRGTECNAALNDLGALNCTVSGVRLEEDSFQVERDPSGDLFVGLTSRCGTLVVGYVEEESTGGAEPDLDELMLTLERVFRGEKAFPSTTSFRIAYVGLPLDAVRDVLSALGVEYVKAAGQL